jgi:hypothetical protein
VNVYHDRNKTGTLKRWRAIRDSKSWTLEVLDGINVSDTQKSIVVEPVYRRIFSLDKNGPLIIEINDTVIGISTRFPFIVVMKGDPDFIEER